jgi:hypothetical protein
VWKRLTQWDYGGERVAIAQQPSGSPVWPEIAESAMVRHIPTSVGDWLKSGEPILANELVARTKINKRPAKTAIESLALSRDPHVALTVRAVRSHDIEARHIYIMVSFFDNMDGGRYHNI